MDLSADMDGCVYGVGEGCGPEVFLNISYFSIGEKTTKEHTLLSERELVVEGVTEVLEREIVLVVAGVVLVKDGAVDDGVVDVAGVAELVVVLRAVDEVVLLLLMMRRIHIS
jgi:hypothetical protein